jgi:hypothetical protein
MRRTPTNRRVPTRAAIYARVSTDRQERDQTIESQLTRLTTWCRDQHYSLEDAQKLHHSLPDTGARLPMSDPLPTCSQRCKGLEDYTSWPQGLKESGLDHRGSHQTHWLMLQWRARLPQRRGATWRLDLFLFGVEEFLGTHLQLLETDGSFKGGCDMPHRSSTGCMRRRFQLLFQVACLFLPQHEALPGAWQRFGHTFWLRSP